MSINPQNKKTQSIIWLPAFNRGLPSKLTSHSRCQPIGLCHVGTDEPIAAHSEEENLSRMILRV